jgi:nucleoside-diphosphate-sugar epimerase
VVKIQFLSTIKVLVAGVAGFIGSHLCEKLLIKSYKVNALVKYNFK